MKLDYQKELTPVLYGDSAVKIIHHPRIEPDRYGFVMHWHDRIELLLIYSGSLIVNCGGSFSPTRLRFFLPVFHIRVLRERTVFAMMR